MSQRELSFDSRMSDAESLMWNLEKDPWLNPSGAMLTILDRPPDMARFEQRIAGAAESIPRLAERVVAGLGRLSPPQWMADPEFDIGHHIRHVALPAPGTQRRLFDLCTKYYEDPFDRSRPLWQFVVIEGLDDGKAALFSKLHHAVTDGIGALRLSEHYIDVERHPFEAVSDEDRGSDGASGARPEAGPGSPDARPASPETAVPQAFERIAEGVGHVLRRQAGIGRRAAGEVAAWTADPMLAAERAAELVSGTRSAVSQLWPSEDSAPSSPLWAERSRRRHLEALPLRLDDLKTTGAALGATVNDMFVGGVALGAHKYHQRRGAAVEGFTASFVVSTRADDAVGGNAFTPARFTVPGSCESPQALVAEIGGRMAALRGEVSGSGLMAGLAGVANLLPTSLVTEMARAQASRIDFATSNLRGPWFPTYIAGARVERNIVMGPVAATAMNATAMSYDGVFDIGLHIDPAAIADPADLRDCMAEAFDELLA